MNTLYTPNLIKWINEYLTKRLGPKLDLSVNDEFWVLTNQANNKSIRFKINNKDVDFSLSDKVTEINCNKFSLLIPGVCDAKQCYDEVGVYFNFDLIRIFVAILNRFEEYNAQVDSYGRFSAYNSHAFKNDYLHRPVIDEWILFIENYLNLHKIKNKKIKVKISHDVDHISNYFYEDKINVIIRRILKDIFNFSFASAFTGINKLFTGNSNIQKDSANSFDWMISIDNSLKNKRNVEFTYFLIISNKPCKFDGHFFKNDICYSSILSKIKATDSQIGLHSSYNSFNNELLFSDNLKTFKKLFPNITNICNRQHYLRFTIPTTWNIFDSAEINNDSSLGYPEVPGFRAGTSHSYSPFNLLEDKRYSFDVHPLIVMDWSLLSSSYTNCGYNESLKYIKKLFTECKKNGGEFSILWHNHLLQSSSQKKLYTSVINYIRENA